MNNPFEAMGDATRECTKAFAGVSKAIACARCVSRCNAKPDKHLLWSLIKSGVRIVGCISTIWLGWSALAVGLAIAEVLGIIEEVA